jgi:DNA helicase-2/ATP-dependent DNA helicase PcrA
MDTRLLQGLNPAQARAVTHEGGPLLIVAGAGSGKTRVLTHRIAWLISEKQVSPYEILAITFTNKAADEMRERVAKLVGSVAERMWVSTFHAACARILRRDAHLLGYKRNFTIYDQSDSTRLAGYVIRDLGIDAKRFPARHAHAAISAAKNELLDPAAYAEAATTADERRIAEVYREYQRRLLEANAMDFDDLLLVTVKLLCSEPEVLSHYQGRFRHVLVDEYQDTNRAQNQLVLMLAARHRHVTVVGDSDQSIYAWRGADIRNILDFEKAFPDTTVVVLDRNYRSTQTILDAANAVIARNQKRVPKDLWTEAGRGAKVVLHQAGDEREEGQWVASELEALKRGRTASRRHYEWGEMAVFYRVNSQSRAVEEALVEREIPYQVVGGPRFYERKEVKDMLAYLRAVANPADEVSLKRVINVPKRGVGDTSVARLDRFAAATGVPFGQALERAAEADVSGRALVGVSDLLRLLAELRAELPDLGPGGTLEAIAERSGYIEELRAEHTIEAQGRIENIEELIGAAREAEDLDSFLERVSLVADADEVDADESKVTLMTLHTAKGLEYPVVFIVGMEEGIFPHLLSMADEDRLEEERRLAYVGITRAKERLYLSAAWTRSLWGRVDFNSPSRFLEEIPAKLLEATEAPPARAERSFLQGRERLVDAALRRQKSASVHGSGADRLGLRAGETVLHKKWGEGVVLEVEAGRAVATIRFPGVGEKVLDLSMAPLKRA